MKIQNKLILWFLYLIVISLSASFLWKTFLLETESSNQSEENRQDTQMEILPQETAVEDLNKMDALKEEYNLLVSDIQEKEGLLQDCREQISIEETNKYAMMSGYVDQMQSIDAEYQPLLNYTVNNFKTVDDIGAMETVRGVKQFQYAVGELAKYTPWGIAVNLFTSMSLDNMDKEYDVIANANSKLSTGIGDIIIDAKASVEAFENRLAIYESLVEDGEPDGYYNCSHERLREVWENQYLLNYSLSDQPINLERYAEEVQKKLYILGQALQLVHDFYSTALISGSNKSVNLAQIQERYEEISNTINQSGSTDIATAVSSDELGQYLIPLIDACISAIHSYVGAEYYSPNQDAFLSDTSYGRIEYHYRDHKLMCISPVTDRVKVHIYYAGGEPIYINGYYCFHGKVLNGEDIVNGVNICEEAAGLGLSRGNRAAIESHLRGLSNIN